jgi:hypothetical protein
MWPKREGASSSEVDPFTVVKQLRFVAAILFSTFQVYTIRPTFEIRGSSGSGRVSMGTFGVIS